MVVFWVPLNKIVKSERLYTEYCIQSTVLVILCMESENHFLSVYSLFLKVGS